MAKQKEENLGTFIKKHPTGMLETDKGEKSFQGNLGDTFMRGEDGKTFIVAKGTSTRESKAEKAARLEEEARLAQEAEAARLEEEARLAQEAEAARLEAERLAAEAE